MTDDRQHDLFGQLLAVTPVTPAGKSSRPVFGSPPPPAKAPVTSAPAPAPTGGSAVRPAAASPATPRGKAAPATGPTETDLAQGQVLVRLLEAMLTAARTSLHQRAGLLPIPTPALDPRLLGGAARLAVRQPALLAQVRFLLARPANERADGDAAAAVAEPAATDADDETDALIADAAGADADDDSG